MKYTVDVNVTITIDVADDVTEDEAIQIALYQSDLECHLSRRLDKKIKECCAIDIDVKDVKKG